MTYTRWDNPLTKVIDSAHLSQPRQAVMVLFQAFNDRYAAHRLFPEARIGNLDWVDPAYKPMQDYLIDMAVDLVTQYPVDGISLDMVRYPTGIRADQLPYTKNRSRVEVITEFVRRFTAAIRAVDPTIDVSANVFGEATLEPQHGIGQDVVALQGAVDFVLPMLYPYTDHVPGAQAQHYAFQKYHVERAIARGVDPEFIKPDIQGFFGFTFDDLIAQAQGVRDAGGTGVLVYAYDFDMGWDPEKWAQMAQAMPENWSERRFRQQNKAPRINQLQVDGATVIFQTDALTTAVVTVEPVRSGVAAIADRLVPKPPATAGQPTDFPNRVSSAQPTRFHALFVPGLVPPAARPGERFSLKVQVKDLFGNKSETTVTIAAPTPPIQANAGANPLTLTQAPQTQNLTAAWTALSWESNVPTVATVEYGTTPLYGKAIHSGTLSRSHRVWITDLAPGKTYHYRVTLTDAWGNRYQTANRTFSTPRNLAEGKQATASSRIRQGFDAAKAFDGSLQTRWSSQYADDQWLQVDLGQTETISWVGLEWEYAYSTSYAIQVSVDGRQWKTVYQTASGQGGREDVRFEPTRARFVRLHTRARGTALGNSLWEMQVFR